MKMVRGLGWSHLGQWPKWPNYSLDRLLSSLIGFLTQVLVTFNSFQDFNSWLWGHLKFLQRSCTIVCLSAQAAQGEEDAEEAGKGQAGCRQSAQCCLLSWKFFATHN